MAIKSPPVPELEFLKLSSNYLELTRKLSTLAFSAPDLGDYANHVCAAWFRLGEAHLLEAKNMPAQYCSRAIYSRAYYAAYNASKGVRYLVQGFVSLKGDDHNKASTDLPKDFPDVGQWANRLSILYENRLRADYDNWVSTEQEFNITPEAAIADAEAFIREARNYLESKCNLTP